MVQAEGKQQALTFHPALRAVAQGISYIFHPLFIPVYVGWFFINIARLFPELDPWGKSVLQIQFIVNYTILPLVTILVAKGLGFVQSIYLKEQKDRIIPYVATGLFYFWIWYVFKNHYYPKPVVMFSLAIFLSSSLGLMVNSYLKVSMHALSMGVLMTIALIMGFSTYQNYGPFIAIAFLVAGLVCTARLVLSGHTAKEIYVGLACGILAQVVAYFFV